MALLASTCRRLIGEQTEKLKPGDDNYQQVPPHPQTVNLPPRWLPQSPAVTAPSRRELWGAYLYT